MAITVSLALTNVGPAAADTALNAVVSITNNGANTISIYDVHLSEVTQTGAQFRQPDYLVPNVAPGTYPTIATTATSRFPCAVVAPGPSTPGASPNAPNGSRNPAAPPGNTVVQVACVVTAYDATAGAFVNGSASMQFPVKSAVAPFPVPVGGALQFNAGGDAVNWFFL